MAGALPNAFDLLEQMVPETERKPIENLREWYAEDFDGFSRNITKLLAFKGVVIPEGIIQSPEKLEWLLKHERLHQFILNSPSRRDFQNAYLQFTTSPHVGLLADVVSNTIYTNILGSSPARFFDEFFVMSQYPDDVIRAKESFEQFNEALQIFPQTSAVLPILEKVRGESDAQAFTDIARINQSKESIAKVIKGFSEARFEVMPLIVRDFSRDTVLRFVFYSQLEAGEREIIENEFVRGKWKFGHPEEWDGIQADALFVFAKNVNDKRKRERQTPRLSGIYDKS